MQQRLSQWGSRLCRRCVLEPHNALAQTRKWHIPQWGSSVKLGPLWVTTAPQLLDSIILLLLSKFDQQKMLWISMRLNTIVFLSVAPYPDMGGAGQWWAARKGRSDGTPGLTFCSPRMIDRLLGLFLESVFGPDTLQHGRAEDNTHFTEHFLYYGQTKQWHNPLTA